MPLYTVTVSETRDGRKREAVARYADGGVAGAVLRGDSTQDLVPRVARCIVSLSPYRACVEALAIRQEARDVDA